MAEIHVVSWLNKLFPAWLPHSFLYISALLTSHLEKSWIFLSFELGGVDFSLSSEIPSGSLLHSYLYKPSRNSGFSHSKWWIFPQLCQSFPEGKSHKIPWNHHFPVVFPWFSHGSPVRVARRPWNACGRVAASEGAPGWARALIRSVAAVTDVDQLSG